MAFDNPSTIRVAEKEIDDLMRNACKDLSK
jgi:hypothetical protein